MKPFSRHPKRITTDAKVKVGILLYASKLLRKYFEVMSKGWHFNNTRLKLAYSCSHCGCFVPPKNSKARVRRYITHSGVGVLIVGSRRHKSIVILRD